MATHRRTREEVVTKTETVTECDYCRLITTDDIGDDQEFSKMLLNPEFTERGGWHDSESHNRVFRRRATKVLEDAVAFGMRDHTKSDAEFNISRSLDDLEKIVWEAIAEIVYHQEQNSADLCPNCVNSLFGPEEPSGIRAGTGYVKLK